MILKSRFFGGAIMILMAMALSGCQANIPILPSSNQPTDSSGCTPEPCAAAGGVVVSIAQTAVVYSNANEGRDEYVKGGLELTMSVYNGSTQDRPLLPAYFSIVGSDKHRVTASIITNVHGASTPAHDCGWDAPILSTGGSMKPAALCFSVPVAAQQGTLILRYDDTVDPAVIVPFVMDGSSTIQPNSAPSPSSSLSQGGGSAPAGTYKGTLDGFTVSFSTDGRTVSAFSSFGTWYCPNGTQAIEFVVPQSIPISPDGSFSGNATTTAEGVQSTWAITGKVTGSSAAGSLDVLTSQACELVQRPWTASLG